MKGVICPKRSTSSRPTALRKAESAAERHLGMAGSIWYALNIENALLAVKNKSSIMRCSN
jgi:hypothetical protein